MNAFEQAYVAELRAALTNRTDLTAQERTLLEHEVTHIEKGTVGLTGHDSVEGRLWRLRNHYP